MATLTTGHPSQQFLPKLVWWELEAFLKTSTQNRVIDERFVMFHMPIPDS